VSKYIKLVDRALRNYNMIEIEGETDKFTNIARDSNTLSSSMYKKVRVQVT
jgi:hypothetical protein